MKTGDRVTWIHTTRAGYGYTQNVAAVYLRETATRVLIKVAQRDPLKRQWVTRTRWVQKGSLVPRTIHVPEVDDTPNPEAPARKPEAEEFLRLSGLRDGR